MGSTALVGIIGVAAGSLTTGGVQAWLARRQRLIDARAAARVVWGGLSDGVAMLEGSEKEGSWTIEIYQLDEMIAVWGEQKIVLGRVVDSWGYRRIDTAFGVLRGIKAQVVQGIEDADTHDEGYADVFEFEGHSARMRDLNEASAIAVRAGQGPWDRVRDPRRTKRMKAELAALGADPDPARGPSVT